MPKSFSAATPPRMIRFNSNSDRNVPIPGAGMLVVPRTADFLVRFKFKAVLLTLEILIVVAELQIDC